MRKERKRGRDGWGEKEKLVWGQLLIFSPILHGAQESKIDPPCTVLLTVACI
jgi:hypothetical protein